MSVRPGVHLRMLTSEDAGALVQVDQEVSPALARPFRWDEEKIAAELDEGLWASDDRWGWAIVADGQPVGFALVSDMSTGDANLELRISAASRGRGVGREVLRQLADHHFSAAPDLRRVVGRTHENNVPMQRAFTAAGFRMEARYRDSYEMPDGRLASEWGYALTRTDWEGGLHRADDLGYDLHGLTFVVEDVLDGDEAVRNMVVKFLQEGRRALARYGGGDIAGGELAGILQDDLLVYRFIHEVDTDDGHRIVTGNGRARLQRRQDGRLEVVNDWSSDTGAYGKTFLVERR